MFEGMRVPMPSPMPSPTKESYYQTLDFMLHNAYAGPIYEEYYALVGHYPCWFLDVPATLDGQVDAAKRSIQYWTEFPDEIGRLPDGSLLHSHFHDALHEGRYDTGYLQVPEYAEAEEYNRKFLEEMGY